MTGDIADWRLIVLMSPTGMSAYLKNTADPSLPYETVVDEHWEADDSTLLSKIEATVYDNPRILDDFSSTIVIMTPKALWIPKEKAEEDEDAIEHSFNMVYSAEAEDIMADENGDLLNVYSLTPGLLPFLQRTFPGARISNHLTILARRFAERPVDGPAIYADISQKEVDILLFNGGRLLCGATHPWRDFHDIEYRILNLIDLYELDPAKVHVFLSGLRDVRGQLMESLRNHVEYVMLTMLPAVAKEGLPLSAALTIHR